MEFQAKDKQLTDFSIYCTINLYKNKKRHSHTSVCRLKFQY